MDSKVVYSRGGERRSLPISTRLVPNLLAVKFTVLAHEMEDPAGLAEGVTVSGNESFIEAQLVALDICIVDVQPIPRRRSNS